VESCTLVEMSDCFRTSTENNQNRPHGAMRFHHQCTVFETLSHLQELLTNLQRSLDLSPELIVEVQRPQHMKQRRGWALPPKELSSARIRLLHFSRREASG